MNDKYYNDWINKVGKRYDRIYTYQIGGFMGLISKIIFAASKKGLDTQLRHAKFLLWRMVKTSHVAMYYGNNTVIDINARGICMERMRDYKKSKYVISLGEPLYEVDEKVALEYITETIGSQKYDFKRLVMWLPLQIFGILPWVKTDYDPKATICSEWDFRFHELQGHKPFEDMEAQNATPLALVQAQNQKYKECK